MDMEGFDCQTNRNQPTMMIVIWDKLEAFFESLKSWGLNGLDVTLEVPS